MKARRFSLSLAAAMLFAAVWSPTPSGANPGTTVRVTGAQPNGATPAKSVTDKTSPALALDGLAIAFSSDATNLVTGDTNGVADVFVRTLPAGSIKRVSVAVNGGQANGASWDPAISVDGRYIAFVSKASNLVPNDVNGFADVFWRDLKTGKTQLVSVGPGGVPSNGDSSFPFISLFGRWVTFESTATNLDPDDTNAMSDAFLRDTSARVTSRVIGPEFDTTQTIIPHSEPPLPSLDHYNPSVPLKTYTTHAQISYDGRMLTYTRGVQGYTPSSPAALDTFFVDRKLRTTTQLPAPPYAGRLPTGDHIVCRSMSDHVALSADGRYAAFESWSACGVPPSDAYRHAIITNPVAHTMIYRFDPQHPKAVSLLCLNSWGLAPTDGDCTAPSIAANGQAVAFQSNATSLVAGDTNGEIDVFVRDLGARTTSRVSMTANGDETAGALGNNTRPSISYEGRNVAFASDASDLVAGDTNGVIDLFVHDRQNRYPDTHPVLAAPVSGRRTINAFEEVHLTLHATDKDRDPLRYGVILWETTNGTSLPVSTGLPDGATIDPLTGDFRWTPRPPVNPDAQHNNACGWCEVKVKIVFWAGDPLGYSDVKLAEFRIRDAQATMRCKVLGQCDV